ncbi:MAG TPA: hypothetical protein VF333_09985 [Pyrinomonadaceae bacterium]
MQTEELTLSYATRINQIHAEGEFLGLRLKDLTIDVLNKVREGGILLDAAKSELGAQGWQALQGQLKFGDHHEQMVRTYLTFARKASEPITDVAKGTKLFNEAMMVTGLLPFPETFEGQQLHQPNFFSYLNKALMGIRAEMHKKLSRNPIETWSQSAKEQFVHQIKPLVAEINEVIARAESA